MTKAKRIDQIDLSAWTLDATDAVEEITEKINETLKGVVLKAAGEVLDLALKEEVFVTFYSDKADADPMTMRVALPVGGRELEAPEWEFSLREVVENKIENSDTTGRYPEHRADLEATRDGLRELADMIDVALRKAPM